MKRAIAAIVLALGLGACGQGAGVHIENAEFRPPLGASGIGVAYFAIRSDKADRIVAISSPEADRIEIHASVTQGGNVSMKHLAGVDLPAGETVRFAPGGMHLMVFSPRHIGANTAFPITIELQSGAKQSAPFREISGVVEPRG
ncbi:MAG: copper chaperone PCu(A)C [Hyphomonadaceae bacterium]|nr:copper chaperone PCu(A)C [Hyphomonadaceae bacterium]